MPAARNFKLTGRQRRLPSQSIPEFFSIENATDIRFLFGPSSIPSGRTFKRRPKLALNHSLLAPAISPLPSSDRRCKSAAGFPPRRLSPAPDDRASGTRPGPPFECIALLLQGGGALGAYQAGVYEALAEADLHPDWIAGISIGAI